MPSNTSGEIVVIDLIFLGIYLIFLLAMAVGFFYACYIIAKNNNMSGFYTLLGFFGVIGVIIVFVISIVTTNDNSQNKYRNKNGYNGPNGYGNQNGYNNQNGFNNNSCYNNESKPQFKYCAKCGNKIESSALFCSYCGKAFNE